MSRGFGSAIITVLCLVCGCGQESGTVPTPAGAAGEVGQPSAASAGSAAVGHWSFVDRTANSGLSFQYENGEEAGHFSILESLGGGLAPLDFDGDGRVDRVVHNEGDDVARLNRGAAVGGEGYANRYTTARDDFSGVDATEGVFRDGERTRRSRGGGIQGEGACRSRADVAGNVGDGGAGGPGTLLGER